MFLHIFTHIKTEHCIFIAEHCLCKSLAKFCFTDTRRTEEDKRTDRSFRVFKTYSASSDSLCDCSYSLALTDNSFVENILHVKKSFAFFLSKLNNRDTCPFGNNLCDILGSYLTAVTLLLFLPLLLCIVKLCLKFLLLITKSCSPFKVLLVNCACLFFFIVCNFIFKLLYIIRRGKRCKPYL